MSKIKTLYVLNIILSLCFLDKLYCMIGGTDEGKTAVPYFESIQRLILEHNPPETAFNPRQYVIAPMSAGFVTIDTEAKTVHINEGMVKRFGLEQWICSYVSNLVIIKTNSISSASQHEHEAVSKTVTQLLKREKNKAVINRVASIMVMLLEDDTVSRTELTTIMSFLDSHGQNYIYKLASFENGCYIVFTHNDKYYSDHVVSKNIEQYAYYVAKLEAVMKTMKQPRETKKKCCVIL